MPDLIVTGTNVRILVASATKRLESIAISIIVEKFTIDSIDGPIIERGSGKLDASMSIVGEDSEDPEAMTAAEAMALVIAKAAPEALGWTNRGTSPVSKLPANFFTIWPLATWRFDSVDTGSGKSTDVGKYTLKMTPGNAN